MERPQNIRNAQIQKILEDNVRRNNEDAPTIEYDKEDPLPDYPEEEGAAYGAFQTFMYRKPVSAGFRLAKKDSRWFRFAVARAKEAGKKRARLNKSLAAFNRKIAKKPRK